MLCLKSWPCPRQRTSCTYLKHLMILVEPCLPWGSSDIRVSQSTSSTQALLGGAHWYLFRALLPRWKKFPCYLELKDIFYTTNLIMLLSPNLTLRLELRYFSRLSGFCDIPGSHMLCFCSYWSLCLKHCSSPTAIPCNPLYPAGLGLSSLLFGLFPCQVIVPQLV